MNLSEYSSEVVGFDSTWDKDKPVLVRDAGTDVMQTGIELVNKFTSTVETSEIGIQANPVVLSNSNEDTDKKLAAWLKKIMPALEKELEIGPTPVYGGGSGSIEKAVRIEEYQDIDLKHHFNTVKNFSQEELKKGTATWLSVSTQDSPVLAISCSFEFEEQNKSVVIVLEPRRSKTDAKIYWHEIASIPVKEPIEFLKTNPHDRDMFAGASSAGDLYVWTYHNTPGKDDEQRVTEIFSKVSGDTVVALTFLSNNRILCCHSDGSIVVYRVVSTISTVVDKIMKIEPRNSKDPLITTITTVPEVEDDFVLGLFNGSLLYCTTKQLVSQNGIFNPIVRELQAHDFAVSSIMNCQHGGKSYVVSCDISGEIFFNEIEDNLEVQPKRLKLPLPLKSIIAVTKNMEHIFCPLDKGSLEVFRTSSNVRETLIEGKIKGSGNVIELSRNESWLVTGIYNGTFRIFHLIYDN